MELEAELRYFSEEETQLVSRVKELRSLLPSSKKELVCPKSMHIPRKLTN